MIHIPVQHCRNPESKCPTSLQKSFPNKILDLILPSWKIFKVGILIKNAFTKNIYSKCLSMVSNITSQNLVQSNSLFLMTGKSLPSVRTRLYDSSVKYMGKYRNFFRARSVTTMATRWQQRSIQVVLTNSIDQNKFTPKVWSRNMTVGGFQKISKRRVRTLDIAQALGQCGLGWVQRGFGQGLLG